MKKLLFLTAMAMLVAAAPFCHADERELERKTARAIYELGSKPNAGVNGFEVSTALARLGATDAALEMARRGDLETFSRLSDDVLFQALRRKIAFGKMDEARTLFGRLREERLQSEALWWLAQGEIARGNWLQAQSDLFALAKSQKKLAHVSTNLAVLFAKAGEHSAANRIFDRAQKVVESKIRKFSNGQRGVDSFTHSQFVGDLVRAGYTKRAINFVEKSGFQANALDNHLVERGDWRSLETLYKDERDDDFRVRGLALAALAAQNAGENQTSRELARRVEAEFRRQTGDFVLLKIGQNPMSEDNFHLVYAALEISGETELAAKFLAEGEPFLADETQGLSLLAIFILREGFDGRSKPLLNHSGERLDFLVHTSQLIRNSQITGSETRRVAKTVGKRLAKKFLELGKKKRALELAVWLDGVLDSDAKGASPREVESVFYERQELAEIFRESGDGDRAQKTLQKALNEEKRPKDTLHDALIWVQHGFVSQGRALLFSGSKTRSEISAAEWGRAESLDVARQNAAPDFVEWSDNWPQSARLQALTAYAENLEWPTPKSAYEPFPFSTLPY